MGLFDSGIGNFIKMLVVIGLISMLYMFVMQKVKEQNHKISSMLNLITTLANEVNVLKLHGLQLPDVQQNTLLTPVPPLIPVSDDSESESETDSDDETDEEDNANVFPNETVDFPKDLSKIEITEFVNDVVDVNQFVEEVNEVNLNELEVEIKPAPVKDLKKLSTGKLIDLLVERGENREEISKLKKPVLLSMLQ